MDACLLIGNWQLDDLPFVAILNDVMTRATVSLLCLSVFLASDLSAQLAPPNPAEAKGAPATFQVRNRKFKDLLRPEDANSADGTRIVLYPKQQWKCLTWRFHRAGESGFQLENLYTSKTFAADADTANAQPALKQVPFGKNPADRPTWKMTRLSDGGFRISDAKSGKALTAVKGENGIAVVLDTWADKEEQKWDFLKIDPKSLTM